RPQVPRALLVALQFAWVGLPFTAGRRQPTAAPESHCASWLGGRRMTTHANWRFASATVIGSSHLRTGTPCQDHYRCRVFRNGEDEPIIAIVVSDGAGSAIRAEDGAAITCTTLLEQVEFFLAQDRSLSSITDDDAHDWLDAVREAIADQASDAQLDVRDYA